MLRRLPKKRKFSFKFSKTHLILPLVFLTLGAFFYLGLFKVKNVEAELKNVDCASPEQIIFTLNIKDRYFFLLDKGNLEKKLKNKFLCIKDIKISNYLSGKTRVFVSAREPVASLLVSLTRKIEENTLKVEIVEATSSTEEANKVKNRKVMTAVDYYLQNESTGSAKFLVDGEGKVFAEKENQEIPLFTIYNSEIRLGGQVDSNKINNLVKIFKKLKELEIMDPKVKVFEDLIVIDTRPRVLMLANKDVDYQLASLQLILQKAKIEFRSIESVDLRFNKPVVVFTPKK